MGRIPERVRRSDQAACFSVLEITDASIPMGDNMSRFSLLRANPPKGGDAEPRGYSEFDSPRSPSRQRPIWT
jgi:hypothetical protein